MKNMTTKAAIISTCGTLRENNAEQTAHKLVTYADWEAAQDTPPKSEMNKKAISA